MLCLLILQVVVRLTTSAKATSRPRPSNSFYISNLAASDYRYAGSPDETHVLTLTVSNPGASPGQGGNASATCSIYWAGSTPPSCYTPCYDYTKTDSSSPYWSRVASFQSAGNLTLEVVEYFDINRAVHVLNRAVVVLEDGEDSYKCYIEEDERTICGLVIGDGPGAVMTGRDVVFQTERIFRNGKQIDAC